MTEQRRSAPKPRLLTVGYHYYESRHQDCERRYRPRQVPILRLSGDWMKAAGFQVDREARVQVTGSGLVVMLE